MGNSCVYRTGMIRRCSAASGPGRTERNDWSSACLALSITATTHHVLALEACDRLPETLAHQVEMRFFGRVEQGEERPLTSRFGTVKQMGFFPYEEALHLLEETDFLLLPVDSPTAHAGKLFEYLATGKPILALTPPHGEVARMIRETASGWSSDPKDPAADWPRIGQGYRSHRLRTRFSTSIVSRAQSSQLRFAFRAISASSQGRSNVARIAPARRSGS